MIYLALGILASTLVLLLFRGIASTSANTAHVIMAGYLISALCGLGLFPVRLDDIPPLLILAAAVEGVAFYVVFRLMAQTTQVNGVAIAGIASKMGVIIPIGIGIIALGESASWLKLFGMAAGIAAVVLPLGGNLSRGDWRWPVMVFLGTGCIDASFKLFQVWGLAESEFPSLITVIFGFAFIASVLHQLRDGAQWMNRVSVAFSVPLGIANFATVYFLMMALARSGWESSVVYPINNFGVILCAALAGVFLFRERPSVRTWGGIGLAGLAIGLLYLENIQ